MGKKRLGYTSITRACDLHSTGYTTEPGIFCARHGAFSVNKQTWHFCARLAHQHANCKRISQSQRAFSKEASKTRSIGNTVCVKKRRKDGFRGKKSWQVLIQIVLSQAIFQSFERLPGHYHVPASYRDSVTKKSIRLKISSIGICKIMFNVSYNI